MGRNSSRLSNASRVLGEKTVIEVDFSITNLAFHNRTPPNYPVPKGLKDLLGLNMNFCPTPNPGLTNAELLNAFRILCRSYRLKMQFGNERTDYNPKIYVPNPSFNPAAASPEVEDKLAEIEEKINNATLPRHRKLNLSPGQNKLLRELRQRKDLVVLKADKNLGPVLMLTCDYREMCLKHLNSDTYQQIDLDKDIVTEHLRIIVKRFHDEASYSKDNKIITAGIDNKELNMFYGLAKIHKPGELQPRPIISNATGILGGLSKWLDVALQPYVLNLRTYIRDSDQILEKLKYLNHEEQHQIFTFDVVSMYTSIDTNKALKAIAGYLPKCQRNSLIIRGLEIIMKNNYFTFDGNTYHQKNGTAMGTAVAPTYAILFLGIIEEKIWKIFQKHFVLNARYIDDGLMIWNDSGEKYSFNKYLAMLTRESGLKFTWSKHLRSAVVLDIEISWNAGKYYTKTFEKELNLYLYVTANSAHPPGTLKSIVYGRVLKYWKQNSKEEDFYYFCTQLFHRLQARGYHSSQLHHLFNEAIALARRNTVEKRQIEQIFLKLYYDPNGPKRSYLAELMEFSNLEKILKGAGVEKITLCYKKPLNLKSIISPTSRLSNLNQSKST